MSTMTVPQRYTPEDLLRMPDGNRYELTDGRLVERNMSMWSSFVAGVIYFTLLSFCHGKRLGWIFPEGTSYQCFPNEPGKVRKPDTSFIRLDRLSLAQVTEEGHCTIAPDLAVEVISRNDTAEEIDERAAAFLRAGTSLVWVVNPRFRTVVVHRRQGQGTVLREGDELTGEEVIPGFRCQVRELFVTPTEEGIS